MLFLPQGCKSGKMQSGPGSTPLPVVSISSRPRPKSTSPEESPWTQHGWCGLEALLHLPARLSDISAGKGTLSKQLLPWFCSSWSMGVMDCIHFTRRTAVSHWGSGCSISFFSCFLIHEMMCVPSKPWAAAPQLGWVTLMSPALCWCDCGLSCACKLLHPRASLGCPDLPGADLCPHQGTDLPKAGGEQMDIPWSRGRNA